jgi:hypothetical protein
MASHCKLFVLILFAWLGNVVVAEEPVYDRHVNFAINEYVPWHLRAIATGTTPPFTTAEADELGQPQHLMICRLLGIAPIWLRSFRWGESLSPEGHPLYGTSWFRAVSGPQSDTVMMRFDHAGKVLYHSKQPLRHNPQFTGIILLHDSWVPNTFQGARFLDPSAITVEPTPVMVR